MMAGRIAYQGAPGAFGEAACRRFLPDHERVAVPTFAAVIDALLSGAVDRGMIPVENSVAGPVPGVSELLARPGLIEVDRHALPVQMHFMALPGARLQDIKVISSHPVALRQCRLAIDQLGVATRDADNTALAALALKESGKMDEAVAASEAAADAYGLTILSRDVHDRPDNATTFVVLAREQSV